MRMEDPLARLGNLAPLIERHAPYLHLHPSESFHTGAFEDFIADPGMHYGPPRNKHPVPHPLPAGRNSRGGYLYYDWSDARIRGGDLDRTRIYIHALEHQVWGTDQPPAIALQFWFWYPFNGAGTGRVSLRLELQLPTKVKRKWPSRRSIVEDRTVLDHSFSGTIGLGPFGEHQGDWEHATLFFDHEESLKMIRCQEHDSYTDYHSGDWAERNGRPVLYSALNGHPTYATPGEHPTRKKNGGKVQPVSSMQSVVFDAGIARVQADVRVGLVDQCRAGPAVDCAMSGRVVAVSTSIANGPLRGLQGPPAPPWLTFQGRAGDAEPAPKDSSKKFVADLTRSFVDTFLDPVDQILPGDVRALSGDIAKDIVGGIGKRVAPSLLKNLGKSLKIGGFGPRMPAGESDWMPGWQAR